MRSKVLLLRAAACVLASALCALGFAAAMGMLPSSPLPVWLPVLAALCGGGLCAYVCFTDPKRLRVRSFRGWGARLCAVVCAALLVALSLELFMFNHRAFLTRGCEPAELPLDFFTTLTGEYLSEDGSPIELVPNEALTTGEPAVSSVYLTEGINEETVAIRCRLSGARVPVEMTVRVEDEGNAYFFVQANSGVLLPGSPEDTFEGALYSNGSLYGLCLEFSVPQDGGVYLESVELNPNIAVRWRPVRMVLCFLVTLLALCMLCFPWRDVTYRRGRASHRAVIAVPMLLLMLLNVAFCVLSCSPAENGDPFRGVWNLRDVGGAPGDAYNDLFDAFRNGQLHLLAEPPQELLSLANPYDTSERAAYDVEAFYDYAMYEGRYYVYFGPAPLLLLYYPCYWLTGQIPTLTLAMLLLSLMSTPLIYWALLGMVSKYGKRPNLFLLSLGCFTVACVAGWPMMATLGQRYENAVACAVVMCAGALGFGFHALTQKRGFRRAAMFALCGVFFALQGMSRASTLLMTTAMLAPGFVGVLRDRAASVRSKARDSACFLIPALAGVGLVMWYNYARFGSVSEFGQLYQLTTEDIRYNVFRAEFIPQALWHNLLDFPSFTLPFPYVKPVFTDINVTGNYLWRMYNVGVLSYPLLWLLPMLAPCLRAQRADGRALCAERRYTCLAPIVIAAVLMVVNYFYAGMWSAIHTTTSLPSRCCPPSSDC